jgi:hypothetical protein
MFSATSADYNTALGSSALHETTTGTANTAVGSSALYNNTTGINNTAVGYTALFNSTIGTACTAVGYNSLASNTTGTNNTACGLSALAANTTGINCTAVGVQALFANTVYTNCSGLGVNAAVTGSNQVQLGDASTTTYAYGAVQNRSDRRDKTDIRDTLLGLDFVMSLRPVDFRWDYRENYAPKPPDAGDRTEWLEAVKMKNLNADGSKKRVRFHHGFIAQEVKALPGQFGGLQDHSVNDGDEVMSLGYSEFIAPIVRAIQTLKNEFEAYKFTHP